MTWYYHDESAIRQAMQVRDGQLLGMIGSQLGGTILKHLLGKKITNNQHFEKCIVHVAKSSCPDLQIPIEKNTIVFLFETRCGLTVCWDSNVNVFHFLAFFC